MGSPIGPAGRWLLSLAILVLGGISVVAGGWAGSAVAIASIAAVKKLAAIGCAVDRDSDVQPTRDS